MTATAPSAERLLEDFAARKPAALARAVSIVENHRPGFESLLAALHPKLGQARRIGITGPPGAGKSTLTTALTRAWRESGLTVGIVAVDPTSPFTGGALLGDRIRMESVALDAGVFIRSMATRGSLGGLAAATREVADVLDAYGFDRVLIETVGVGQSELDIARTADTSVVVLVPESGDSIQTLKAGLMEIADLFVVNKSDRPGADRLRNELELMIGLRGGATMKNVPAHHGVRHAKPDGSGSDVRSPQSAVRSDASAVRSPQSAGWTPPVLRAAAAQGDGIADLIAALDRHADYLERSGELRERRRKRLRERVVEVVERRVRQRLWRDAATLGRLEARVPAMESGETTPFTVADELLRESGDILTRTDS